MKKILLIMLLLTNIQAMNSQSAVALTSSETSYSAIHLVTAEVDVYYRWLTLVSILSATSDNLTVGENQLKTQMKEIIWSIVYTGCTLVGLFGAGIVAGSVVFA